MSHAWTYKAGIFPVNPAMEEGAKSPPQERTNFRSKRWADNIGPPHPSPPLSPQRGNTHRHPAAPMETVVGKHQSPSQQRCRGICPGAEHVSGDFTNRPPADFRVQSPTDVSSLFSSLASSRESLFSDGWDRERSWSAMQLSGVTSPLSLSRAVSPCSSVRSGAFTPTVVRVRRHTLASGSSMLHLPQASCQSSCESLASSVGARSPPPPPHRHRPPLTRLSLLTAILRKGRLPVLSPALQRPYSPCWPINHITLASCTACSAASGLAPVSPRSPLSPSPVRRDGPAEPPQSRWNWDSFRQRPALPVVHIPDGCSSGPRLPETPSSDRSYRTGKGPMFQTVYSRPVTSPTVLRATGGEQGVPPAQVPRPPLQSAAPQLKAVSAKEADLTGPNEGTESTRLPLSRPCWYSSATSPGPKGGANQTDSGSSADKPEQTAPAKLNQPSPQTAAAVNVWARRVCSPPPLPATTRPDCISPPPRSLQSCLKKHQPFTSHSHSHQPPKYTQKNPPAPGNTSAPGPIAVDSPRVTTSPPPHHSSCLPPSRYAPIVFSGWPSPSRSHTSTPSRSHTSTPSPASLARDLSPCPSPCPSASLRSTPSPRPGSRSSECTDREGHKRKPHKIKSSYKSLAAIPTNTLLLDQQVIDKQVEADEPSGAGGVEDPHAEMCSPAQLRQESEELYAVIDKILDDGLPKTKVSSLLAQPSGESSHLVTGLKQTQPNSLARPMGRETKYATVNSPTPSFLERIPAETQTKPGVIRPMLAIPRMRVEDCAEKNRCNPFARYLVDTPAAPSSTSQIMTLGRNKEDGGLGSRSPAGTEGGSLEDVVTTSTSPALFIMESADRRPHPVKPASWHGASATFSQAEVLPEVSETRI